ncbi:MAG: hypothetical protein QXW06_01870 [Thermoplasmata archaeon]
MDFAGPAAGSVVNNVSEFWDKYIIVHDEDQHLLEYLFVNNSIGRYSYGEYVGQSEDGPDGLQVFRFELRGMNTASRPTEDQYVLVRFVLNNTGGVPVMFDGSSGVCFHMVSPAFPNGVNLGGSLLGGTLEEGRKVLSTDIVELPPDGEGSYSFWPHYVLSDNTAGPDNWHELDLTCHDAVVWSDDFEDGMGAGWTVGWTPGKVGCTWYVWSWDGGNRAWCAGILDGTPRNPANNNYLNNMEAYMYQQGDYRLMNLMLSYDYCHTFYHEDDNDYNDVVRIQYYTVIDNAGQWVDIKVYNKNNNTNEWAHESLQIPAIAFESEEINIKIRLLFYTDAPWPQVTVDKGTFIDNVQLVAGGG